MLDFFYTCSYKNIYYERSLIFPKIMVGPKWDDYIKKMDAINYCPIRLYLENNHCELAWSFPCGGEGEGLGVGYQMYRFCFLGQSKIFYQINKSSLLEGMDTWTPPPPQIWPWYDMKYKDKWSVCS